ncbi:MAG: hypothetical protein K2Q18_00830 [Bdellovibrionales bacterium]|nr:hypothetical protein [Bdellovibrionales bacterium]
MKKIALLLSLVSFGAMAAEFSVPATNVLEAARTLKPQNGPYYSVKGTIKCTSINTGWGPATSTCEISVNKRTAQVEDADKIINVVSSVVRRTGPYYSFKGSFVGTSESREFPPYGSKETVKITLK